MTTAENAAPFYIALQTTFEGLGASRTAFGCVANPTHLTGIPWADSPFKRRLDDPAIFVRVGPEPEGGSFSSHIYAEVGDAEVAGKISEAAGFWSVVTEDDDASLGTEGVAVAHALAAMMAVSDTLTVRDWIAARREVGLAAVSSWAEDYWSSPEAAARAVVALKEAAARYSLSGDPDCRYLAMAAEVVHTGRVPYLAIYDALGE